MSMNNMTQNLTKKIVNCKGLMEKALNKHKKEGFSPAEGWFPWIKDTKVMDESKLADLKLQTWTSFKDMVSKRNADLWSLKVAACKMASEQSGRLQDLAVAFAIRGEKLVGACAAAATAFKDAMKK